MTDSSPAEAAAASEAPAPAAGSRSESTVSDDKPTTEESTVGTSPEEASPENGDKSSTNTAAPIVSNSKRSRPPYKYDPNKITLRFLFANRDGLTVTVECKPADTVSEVKGALLSVWPEDLPSCSGGDQLRLICMGKGMLMPDSRTLEDCQVPVFKTHPTPINVSVRPAASEPGASKSAGESKAARGGTTTAGAGSAAARPPPSGAAVADQGCACIIL